VKDATLAAFRALPKDPVPQGCVKPVGEVKLGLGRKRLFGTIDLE
jgi:hypothetical protein